MPERIKVYWHFGGRGSWCHTLVEFLTRGCEHFESLVPAKRAIVVVKADSVPDTLLLAHELNRFESGVLIVCGNEEGTFRTEEIKHPRMKVWLQTPAANQTCDRALPWGWTPRKIAAPDSSERIFNWSFAGQNSHVRRHECIEALRKIPHGLLTETNGFSQGLSRNVYWELLHSTKLVPCPSGPLTVDTFRACESLEAGAIPILDGVSPTGHYRAYWTRVFGPNIPFPIIESWDTLPSVMETWLQNWEERQETCMNWWKAQKGEWLHNLSQDLHA